MNSVKLHLCKAVRLNRAAALKLAVASSVLLTLTAIPAQAQYDKRGSYTSQDTPQARQQKSAEEAKRLPAGKGPSAPLPELQIFAAVDLAEIYTSNAGGTVAGSNKSDFYTRPRLNLAVRQQSARLSAMLDYSLSGEWYARNHRLDQLTHDLNASANAELLSEILFLDAQAFAKPTALSRAGSLVAGGTSPSRNNYRDTYGYAVRPTLIHQFGSFAEVNLWASQSGVFYVTPSTANTVPLPGFFIPPSNSQSTAIGIRIGSLSDFTRLQWSVSATANDTYQSNHNAHKQRMALVNLSYGITHDIRAIFTGGYQTYHSTYSVNKDLDGPTLLGGLQFTPTPNFMLYVMGGTQNNFPTYMGALQWHLSPMTSFALDVQDKVETPQERLMGNLRNGGGFTPGENPVSNPGTPIGSPLPSDGLSMDNSISRYRRLTATFLHTTERMRYSLSVYGTLQDRLNDALFPGLNTRSDSIGIRAGVSRNITQQIIGTASVGASRSNEFNGHHTLLEGHIGARYSASPTLSFYADTAILHRDSKNLIGGFENGNLIDTRVTIGVTKAF